MILTDPESGRILIFFIFLLSPPPSLPNSQPPTREASPAPMMIGQNARTPPPKRWKRSFDMSHPGVPPRKEVPHDQPLSLVRLFILDFSFPVFKKKIFNRLRRIILNDKPMLIMTLRPNDSVNPMLYGLLLLLPMDHGLCLIPTRCLPAPPCLSAETRLGKAF